MVHVAWWRLRPCPTHHLFTKGGSAKQEKVVRIVLCSLWPQLANYSFHLFKQCASSLTTCMFAMLPDLDRSTNSLGLIAN